MCRDALARDESCGGHFREEHQTPEGEALRDDENFADVFAWEYQGDGRDRTEAAQRAARLRIGPPRHPQLQMNIWPRQGIIEMNFKLKIWRQPAARSRRASCSEYEVARYFAERLPSSRCSIS